MSQVISFINMKGGVAKTTLVVNVAYLLARDLGKKVLVVDVDPQFNASTYLMDEAQYLLHRDSADKRTVLHIFEPGGNPSFSTVRGTKRRQKKGTAGLDQYVFNAYIDGEARLDIIPSELQLMQIQTSERGTENCLRTFLQRHASPYDYVLIDCPPTISIFTQAAIMASNRYLVPLKPDPLSTIGLPLLEAWLGNFTEKLGLTVTQVGIVFTLVREGTNQMKDIMADIRGERGGQVFTDFLSESVRVSESVEKHKPVCVYDPSNKCSGQLTLIAREFVKRMDGD